MDTKEENESMTEGISHLDSEIQTLDEKNMQLKKKVMILKNDFAHLTDKKGSLELNLQVRLLSSLLLLLPIQM